MDIKEMTDAELDSISGGAGGLDGCHFLGQVDPHACAAGQSYYVVMGNAWFYGPAEGVVIKDGSELLRFHAVQWNGNRCDMICGFDIRKITVFTQMAVDC